LSARTVSAARTFSHEAFLYAGDEQFVGGLAPFIREGVAAGEPVLVVVGPRKIALLREALNGETEHVVFADMDEVGANPARIIPIWQDFVAAHLARGTPVRGIGEPIEAGHNGQRLAECQRHESLLNVAFADAPAWQLLCPYDTGELDEDVLEEALRSHPHVRMGAKRAPSYRYRGLAASMAPFGALLPPAPPDAERLEFDVDRLAEGRRLVHRVAVHAGVGPMRANDLVLATNEVLTNSIRHGGGRGLLLIWSDDASVVCEVRDRGVIADPLVDRRRPSPHQATGRGLWMANQVCDLVQLRSLDDGNVVRLSINR